MLIYEFSDLKKNPSSGCSIWEKWLGWTIMSILTVAALGENVRWYMTFKDIIEDESWFGFWYKFALNSCDIPENDFWKIGFKTLADVE